MVPHQLGAGGSCSATCRLGGRVSATLRVHAMTHEGGQTIHLTLHHSAHPGLLVALLLLVKLVSQLTVHEYNECCELMIYCTH